MRDKSFIIFLQQASIFFLPMISFVIISFLVKGINKWLYLSLVSFLSSFLYIYSRSIDTFGIAVENFLIFPLLLLSIIFLIIYLWKKPKSKN